MTPEDDRIRYFILTVGRSGSSLLSAILADAGAAFGMAPPNTWDPRRGQMENQDIKWATHHFRRAFDIDHGRRFMLSPTLETRYRRGRARRYLRRALATARYLKIGDLDLAVQPSFKLGFEPRVILNYRRLDPNLASLLVGRTYVGADQLANEYDRVYRQGFALMQTFGGCVVEYNALQNEDDTLWADALAGVTGLERDKLLESRRQRLNGLPDEEETPPLYVSSEALFRSMQTMNGRVFTPVRQVTRAIKARDG